MPNKDLTFPLVAGLLASGLFLLVFSTGLNFLFMFLPSLPLFALGLSRQPHMALTAALLASGMVGIAAGGPPALIFLLFLGFPAWYLASKSLLWQDGPEGQREWYPLGLALLNLTLTACALVALVTAYYAGQPGGLPRMLAQNIHEAFADLQNDYGDMVDRLADQWAFLIFSITIWLWGLALYAHAWLAHRALMQRKLALRPDFAIEVFAMPGWVLQLLAISALASLVGGESMCFLGKSTLISLMLPYFFLGSAILRQSSRTWPSRRFFLFFIYFMVFAQFWPALVISGMGLWHHIKCLSGAGSSYKS